MPATAQQNLPPLIPELIPSKELSDAAGQIPKDSAFLPPGSRPHLRYCQQLIFLVFISQPCSLLDNLRHLPDQLDILPHEIGALHFFDFMVETLNKQLIFFLGKLAVYHQEENIILFMDMPF